MEYMSSRKICSNLLTYATLPQCVRECDSVAEVLLPITPSMQNTWKNLMKEASVMERFQSDIIYTALVVIKRAHSVRTGPDHINSKDICLKCFLGLETWYEGSNQCELIEIASKIIEIGAKLSVGRQVESEEVKCLRDIPERLTS